MPVGGPPPVAALPATLPAGTPQLATGGTLPRPPVTEEPSQGQHASFSATGTVSPIKTKE